MNGRVIIGENQNLKSLHEHPKFAKICPEL